MPTREVATRLLCRIFDAIAPPEEYSTEEQRWNALAERTTLGANWCRKRSQGRIKSELNVKSILKLRDALEKAATTPAAASQIRQLIFELSALTAAKHDALTDGDDGRHGFTHAGGNVRTILNIGFLRGGPGNDIQRLEAGIRFGVLRRLGTTHLLNDVSVELTPDVPPAKVKTFVEQLLEGFTVDTARTYLVPIGTVAAKMLSATLEANVDLQERIGRDFRIIFAGVTDPKGTGIIGGVPWREHIGGMYYGIDGYDRIDFVASVLPQRELVYLYNPRVDLDKIVYEQIFHHPRRAGPELPARQVIPVEVNPKDPLFIDAAYHNHVITGYHFLNENLGRFVKRYPNVAFVGLNTTDLGRGAVLSTGNDDLQFGILCAEQLIVPHVKGEIALRDQDILRPPPIYGINERTCHRRGVEPDPAARTRCGVVVALG